MHSIFKFLTLGAQNKRTMDEIPPCEQGKPTNLHGDKANLIILPQGITFLNFKINITILPTWWFMKNIDFTYFIFLQPDSRK